MEAVMGNASMDEPSDRRGVLLLLPESSEAIKSIQSLQHMKYLGLLWHGYRENIVPCDKAVLRQILAPTNQCAQNSPPLVHTIQCARP